MAAQMNLNGVDVGGISDAISLVSDNPTAGRFTFRARNRWDYGAHCFTTIQDFNAGGQEDTTRPRPFVIDASEPEALLGADEAPNATELALCALASCLNTTFIYHAAAKGVMVEELELLLEGSLDLRGFLGVSEEVRNGFEGIQVTFRVKADASEEMIEQLCMLAQQRSPVFDIITNRVPVTARVEAISMGAEAEKPVSPGI
ncbi:MAG: OsmC family protein [Armatimonadetes bacterium]|nr:OsmC family protein [Armatimonadota bacterium]